MTEFDNQVLITGGGWEQFRRVMLQAKKMANVASDNVVANVGAAGRKAATEVEKKKFNFGAVQGNQKGVKQYSTFDAKLGGFRGTQGRKLRMIGFSWENARSNKNARSFSRSLSSAYAYSLTDNLWENDTKPYRSASPWFFRWGSGMSAGIWGQGTIRKGKNYQGELKRAYAGAIPEAIQRTEQKLQGMINSELQ